MWLVSSRINIPVVVVGIPHRERWRLIASSQQTYLELSSVDPCSLLQAMV